MNTLSDEQLKAAYNGCKEGGHLGALRAVAVAAVKAHIAQQPAAGVGLTDAEIDSFFEDHGWCPDEMYYPVVRDIIAALAAKQGGGL